MGLFDWFRSQPECPIDAETREWLDRRWHWLEGQFGTERVRQAPVVLPRPEFFPDTFRGTEEDVRRMLDRVCGYMDIDPKTIVMSLYSAEDGPFPGQPHLYSWEWQGSVGMYEPEEDQFRLWFEIEQIRDPLNLVATMAHELGHVHLLGHGRVSRDEKDHELLTDLITVYFGLGLFTANSVLRERESKITLGTFVHSYGYLTMPTFGYALAKFARLRGEDKPKWVRELRPDVRLAFHQAKKFLSCDTAVSVRLPVEPETELRSLKRDEKRKWNIDIRGVRCPLGMSDEDLDAVEVALGCTIPVEYREFIRQCSPLELSRYFPGFLNSPQRLINDNQSIQQQAEERRVIEPDGAGGWTEQNWPRDWFVIGESDDEQITFVRPDQPGLWTWAYDCMAHEQTDESLVAAMQAAREDAGIPAPTPVHHPVLGELLWDEQEQCWTSIRLLPGGRVGVYLQPGGIETNNFLETVSNIMPTLLAAEKQVLQTALSSGGWDELQEIAVECQTPETLASYTPETIHELLRWEWILIDNRPAGLTVQYNYSVKPALDPLRLDRLLIDTDLDGQYREHYWGS
ncbi:MAG: SMI1/KNR4 family protein [Fimbriiglobus sp.]